MTPWLACVAWQASRDLPVAWPWDGDDWWIAYRLWTALGCPAAGQYGGRHHRGLDPFGVPHPMPGDAPTWTA